MFLFRFIRHILRKYLRVDWISTIRINSKLPFSQMIHLPIWVYGCKIKTIKGNVKIHSNYMKHGMIRLGLMTSGMCGNYNSVFLDIRGSLIFSGPGYMGNNSVIEIGPSGVLEFGKNFGITGSFKIAAHKKITIGNNFSCSWETSIFDTNFHEIIDVGNGTIFPETGEVFIGNDVWCCQKTTILKNTIIPDRCIIASNSLVNKDFSSVPRNSSIAGIPATLKKYGITRKDFVTFETHPMLDITRFLHLD